MTSPEKFVRPALRYRRLGGGYRREDVEFALAELRLTLRQLENDVEALRDRNRELETELSGAQTEIEAFRRQEHDLNQQIGAALRRGEEIEDVAQARAREIIAGAEEAALRAGSEAEKRIQDTNEQLDELLRLKDNLLEVVRAVIGDFDEAVSRVERGEPVFPEAAPKAAEPVALEPAPSAPPLPAVPTIPEEPPPAEPAELPDEQLFETRVELDAGAFSDFASLSAFERALSRLPKVEDVYVRRLAEDRALIELTLSEATQLLQAMRESLPYSVEVRSASRSKLVVNVSAETLAGTVGG